MTLGRHKQTTAHCPNCSLSIGQVDHIDPITDEPVLIAELICSCGAELKWCEEEVPGWGWYWRDINTGKESTDVRLDYHSDACQCLRCSKQHV
jgi:hypothetical protein